jgi:hypothetical protein
MGPEVPPREDLPTPGFKHYFKISAEGMLSSDFIAYDNDQTSGNPVSAPWLKLVHGGSLDKDEGTVVLEKKAKAEGDGALLNANVGRMEYQTLESNSSEDWGGDLNFFDWSSEPDNTRLVWGAKRSVTVAADVSGEPSARVSMKYAGMARCEKDVDYQGDGDRDVRFNSSAETKSVQIQLELAGKEVTLDHSLGMDRGGDGNFAMKYNVEGSFDIQYISNWGTDEVLINVLEGGDPLTACTVGFIIAYWLHPRRVEAFAMENAERILRSQQGYDW